jgi:ElaB/YqjD/DUF883 family membrane-anchored ribosome-binding protein
MSDETNGPVPGEHPALEQAREKLSRMADEVKGRYRRVSGDVGRRARRAGEDLRRGAETARERYGETGEVLREGYGRAQEKARGMSSGVNAFVQESPGRAVILAAAVGFLVGLLVRGRE